MNKMIVANLLHRPIRSLISIVAVAVEVTLILVIVGILLGILNDNTTRQKGIGADVMVRPPGSSNFLTISGAPVSIKIADLIRKIPHVKVVAPVVVQLGSNATEAIFGIDLATYESLGSPFHYIEGGPFAHPYDLLVDDYFAREQHAYVGQRLEVLNQDFRVCGIIEQGKGGRKFVPITTLQELIGAPGKATVFYVKLDSMDNYAAFRQALLSLEGMQKYSVISTSEYVSLMTPANIPLLSKSINTVIGVAICIGFIVIFQSMYTAVMERTREIGILKSLGASKLYIMNAILRETVLLAALGIILGIVISFVTQQALKHKIPASFDPYWVLRASVIALVGAVLGALYPASLAAQKDPIDALAYE